MALVSVIIPTYNSSKYILETIDAILSQTLQDFEVIIVDDCSMDNTVELLKSIPDTRLKIYVNDKNMGIPYNHNRLLSLVSTDFIAIQDHDDVSYPDRLERQYNFLTRNPHFIATASYPTYIDENGKPIDQFERKVLRALRLNNAYIRGNEVFASLLFKNIFCHSTFMLNKKQLGDLTYREAYGIFDDYDLMIRMAHKGPINIETNPVLKYRMHLTNTFKVRYKEGEALVNKIQSRYLQLLNLNPTADQLYIHNGFYNHAERFAPGIDYLDQSVAWYRLIMQKNSEAHVFDSTALLKVIEKNWFERCYACRKIGTKTVRKYLSVRFQDHPGATRLAKALIIWMAAILKK